MSAPTFEDNQRYRIRNLADGSLLDLQAGSTRNETEVHCWQPIGQSQQIWLANKEGDAFRISCILNDPNQYRVLDMAPSGDAIYYNFHNQSNQQFFSRPIKGGNAVLITCKQNGYSLRNQGRGHQTKFVYTDQNDISQQWVLERA